MNPEDFDLSWLPSVPDDDARDRAKVALVAEVRTQMGDRFNESERMLCEVVTADEIELHIQAERMECQLLLKTGRRRHIKDGNQADAAIYQELEMMRMTHATVAAAIQNLPDADRETIATDILYSLLHFLTPDDDLVPEACSEPDPSRLHVHRHCTIDIPLQFDQTMRALFDQITQGTWGLKAEEEGS